MKLPLKQIGALVMCLIFMQWVFLPSCPCELRALFSATPSTVELIDLDPVDSDGGGMVWSSSDGDSEQKCCCKGSHAHMAHASSPEVSTPEVMFSSIAHWEIPSLLRQAVETDLFQYSGNDPPGFGRTRLHLRCQVFLI